MPKNDLPVIKRKDKWYNTLTKKYVTETYGKRINNYFKKNPEGSLIEATGHGKYDRKKSWTEHSTQIRKLAYKKGNQLIKTKNKEGKTVYLSPFNKEILTQDQIKKLKNLDYYICDGKVHVELYRLTKDRTSIYHILTWYPHKRLSAPMEVDFWYNKAMGIYRCIEKELRSIVKKHSFSTITIIYGHVSCYFISDYDAWENGKTFGFIVPNNEGYNLLKEQFIEILNWYRMKLESDAYHDIQVEKISFYISDFTSNANKTQIDIAKYRLGINRLLK